jgi:hypothetical protein
MPGQLTQSDYKILGLKEGEIDKVGSAYRQLARKYHPDKNNGNKEAEAKFLKVKEVYDKLVASVPTGPSVPIVAHYTTSGFSLYSPEEYEKLGRPPYKGSALEPESIKGRNVALTLGHINSKMDKKYQDSIIDTIKDIQQKESVVKTIDFSNVDINSVDKSIAEKRWIFQPVITDITKLLESKIDQSETTFRFSGIPEYRLEVENVVIDGKSLQLNDNSNTLSLKLSDLSTYFPRVTNLEISNCLKLEPGQDASFDYLTDLKITNSDITSDQIKDLTAICHSLKSLDLSNLKLSGKDLKKILSVCGHGLNILALCGCSELTADDIKTISKLCPNLQLLDIENCDKIKGFPSGAKFPSLTALGIESSNIAGKDLSNISKSCPNLEVLDLEKCQELKKSKIPTLKLLNKLQQIYLPKDLSEDELQKSELQKKVSNACPNLTKESRQHNSLPDHKVEQSFFGRIFDKIKSVFSGIVSVFKRRPKVSEPESVVEEGVDYSKAIILHQDQKSTSKATMRQSNIKTAKHPSEHPHPDHEIHPAASEGWTR